MKLLQLSNYYYPHIGGIEQVANDIACSFGTDIEQKVFCFDDRPSAYPNEKGNVIRNVMDGVEIIRCRSIAKIRSQSLSLSAYSELGKVIDQFKPDVIILHYPNPLMSTCLMRHLSKEFKLVIWWHSDIVKQKILGKLFINQTEKLLKRADRIIATSPNYIEGSLFLKENSNKITVIPNCVSDKRIEINDEIVLKSQRIRNQYSGKIIGFAVGRHVPYKGFSSLIEASQYLNSNIKVIIGGSGPLTEELKKQAKNTDVLFTGKLSEEDLKAYFMASDFILFPSITKNEAFGISLAEGMSFGKPAITYTISGSGVNYVSVDGETGIECKNQDVKEYAAAINKLALDEDLRMKYSENAKERAHTLFSFEKFRENVSAMFSENLSR